MEALTGATKYVKSVREGTRSRAPLDSVTRNSNETPWSPREINRPLVTTCRQVGWSQRGDRCRDGQRSIRTVSGVRPTGVRDRRNDIGRVARSTRTCGIGCASTTTEVTATTTARIRAGGIRSHAIGTTSRLRSSRAVVHTVGPSR